jgi:hypothetical protein
MEITLKRTALNPEFTLGELFIDGAFFCYAVEDTVRSGEKIKGKTAIAYGRYKVIVNMSNRFKKLMPLLLDVPNFEGVRIHSGNTAEDSEGCIIVGMAQTQNGVGMSRIAFTKLMDKLKDQQIIYINIL